MIVFTAKDLMIVDDLRDNILLKRKTRGICLAELGTMFVLTTICSVKRQAPESHHGT